jgi:apolipoprotein N-acyltransferase
MKQKNKWTGVIIMCFGFVACCFLIWLFNLSGQTIDFKDPALVLKFILASATLPIALYFGLLFYGGKKIALQLGGGLGVLMAFAYLLGFLIHH